MSISVLGVIPSRYASTRLPAKPLAKILGKPMVQWVYEAARRALPNVVIATDDQRIVKAVQSFGGKALLTPKSCASGTDRMAYVAKKIKADFYVNIQGDEPMIHPETIHSAVNLAKAKKEISTAATSLDLKDKNNPAAVKVIVGGNQQSIYFSRTFIPFAAHGVKKGQMPFKHLGLYVYPKSRLKQFVNWKPSHLEQTEKLEQLERSHYGAPIYVAYTKHNSIGVDTPADLKKVTKILSKRNSK